MPKTALIAGATGLTGSALLKILAASGTYSKIIVLSRRQLTDLPECAETIITDAASLHLHSNALLAADVFCCLGTTIKKAGSKEAFKNTDFDYPLALARITKENGAKRFLIISSIGANEKSIFFYTRVKGMIENALKESGFDTLCIFRPSLLLGKRKEFRTGEYMGTLLYKALSWIFTGPLRRYRGIRADTVAQAMYKAAQTLPPGIHTIESEYIKTMI